MGQEPAIKKAGRRVTLFLEDELLDRLRDEAHRRNRANPCQSAVVSDALILLFAREDRPARPSRRSLASA